LNAELIFISLLSSLLSLTLLRFLAFNHWQCPPSPP
jgi:hypothetical protein